MKCQRLVFRVRPRGKRSPGAAAPECLRTTGTTLIELLAATVLASLLMGAVVGVLRALHLHERTVAERLKIAPEHRLLEDQLEWDFRNARQMNARPTYLQLVGFAGRDFATGAVIHRPTRVVYRVQPGGGRTWLVREEAHLDANTNRHLRRELVCSDVAELSATRLETIEPPAAAADEAPQRLYPVPCRLRLVLKRSDGSALVDRILLLGPGI